MLAERIQTHPLKSKIVSPHLHQTFLSLAPLAPLKYPALQKQWLITVRLKRGGQHRGLADMLPCWVAQGLCVSVSLCVKTIHSI